MLCFQQGSLVVKLSPLCWFAALRVAGGAFGADVRGSWSSCVFVRSAVVAFWGAAFLSGSLVVKLSPPCWLAAVRGAGGAFGAEGTWLVQVSCKSGCPSCFADASERGVSPRLEVGGLPARFALSKLRLLLFEARLSGYCVREGEVKGINPGFLVVGFSTRTLKSRGGSARRVQAGASAWACCLWFVALLHGRGSWSSCVFRAVHRCCFLGCCFPLSKDQLVVKLSPRCLGGVSTLGLFFFRC